MRISRDAKDNLKMMPLCLAGVAGVCGFCAPEVWPAVTWGLVKRGALIGALAAPLFSLLHLPLVASRADRRWMFWLMLAFGLFLLPPAASGALYAANGWNDRGERTTRRVAVLDAYRTSGIINRGRLVVPLPESPEGTAIRVPWATYKRVEAGDEVLVTTAPGRLGEPWIDEVEAVE